MNECRIAHGHSTYNASILATSLFHTLQELGIDFAIESSSPKDGFDDCQPKRLKGRRIVLGREKERTGLLQGPGHSYRQVAAAANSEIEWPNMFLESLQQYWLPYTISNVIVVAVLMLSWKRPKAGRISLGIIFLLASIVNAKTASTSPADYLFYREMTLLDLYRDFIDGWFATHAQAMVLAIAAGQFVIAMGMFVDQRFWRRVSIIGILIFGIAISPLGVGAAFPFPLLLAFAAILLWKEPLN